MNGKQSKKLRNMAALFYQSQPPDMENKKSLQEIYNNLKSIHRNGIKDLKQKTKES